jgi:fructose-1-phosphate kinase PfkB-like protein
MLAVGPNPAYQKHTSFESFNVDEVNRASSLKLLVGGKGQNFARSACHIFPGRCAVAHFLGGTTGSWIRKSLADDAVPQIVSNTSAQTRTCTTLVCEATGHVTEVIDPSGAILAEEKETLLRKIRSQFRHLKVMAFCGTCPPGASDIYPILASEKPESCTLFLDGYKGVQPVLDTHAVDVYKVAAYELALLTGVDDIKQGAFKLASSYPNIKWLAITDGAKQAFLFAQGADKGTPADKGTTKCWCYTIEPIGKDRLVNPIGAGDTVGGVMAAKFAAGSSMQEAFRCGLAAASAKCLVAGAGGVYRDTDYAECLSTIVMEVI